jgi:hypothetical protein
LPPGRNGLEDKLFDRFILLFYPGRKTSGAIVRVFLWLRAGRTSEPKVGFASIKSALTAEIFLSLHKTVGFTSAVRASNSIDEGVTDP